MGSWKMAWGDQRERCLREGRPSKSCGGQYDDKIEGMAKRSGSYIEDRADGELLLVVEGDSRTGADVGVLDAERSEGECLIGDRLVRVGGRLGCVGGHDAAWCAGGEWYA